MKRVAITQFKATCLHLMDRVATTGEPLEVTKRGKPLVRLVPAASADKPTRIFGAVKDSILYLAPDEELFSTEAVWNAET